MKEIKNNCCADTANTCGQVAPVFLKYEDKLKGFIQKRVNDKGIAEEITQQLFLKLYKNCEQIPRVENLNAWIYQIARNAVVDYFREIKRQSVIDEDTDFQEELEQTFGQEIQALVEPLINLLPIEYAKPLYLSDIEGLPQGEIAKKLGISLSGAKSRIQRGREKLRNLFLECCHLELDHKGNLVHAEVRESCAPLKHLRK